jgi:hypothetical protein
MDIPVTPKHDRTLADDETQQLCTEIPLASNTSISENSMCISSDVFGWAITEKQYCDPLPLEDRRGDHNMESGAIGNVCANDSTSRAHEFASVLVVCWFKHCALPCA